MPGGWRDSKRADKSRAAQSGRSGGARYYSNRWDATAQPQKIHWIRPEKLWLDPVTGNEYPWKKGQRYWLPTERKFIEVTPDFDVVEAYTNPAQYGLTNIKPLERCRSLKRKSYNALAGNCEEFFHLVDFQNRNDPEKTYKSRELCEGRECKWCKEGWPKVFGKRIYTAFNSFQWKTVIEPIMEKVERYCHCGGYIYPTHYECPHCQHVLIDMTMSCPNCGPDVAINLDEAGHRAECASCGLSWSLLESEDQKLNELANPLNGTTCPNCKTSGVYPQIVFACTDPTGKQCPGEPHDLFDVQMRLHQVKQDGKGKNYNLVVDGWEIADPDPRLFDPAHQSTGDDKDAEFVPKVIEAFSKPLPLDQIFSPTDPSEAAQILNVKNPFAGYIPSAGEAQTAEQPAEGEAASVPAKATKPKPAFKQR